jgi:hypothetical protein
VAACYWRVPIWYCLLFLATGFGSEGRGRSERKTLTGEEANSGEAVLEVVDGEDSVVGDGGKIADEERMDTADSRV